MRILALSVVLYLTSLTPIAATASECFALTQHKPRILKANPSSGQLNADEVRLTFLGHASFLIESIAGQKIVTDYSGNSGNVIPDAVTMNRAHRTHYTDTPDPRIKHVLRGWNEDGTRAVYNIEIGDIRVRNVTTDIRGYPDLIKDGNSIFIFEVAGLCIGHLGHLHHFLGPKHITQIGRLDIVMVPVDGSYTMSQAEMHDLLKMLKTRIIIPMHFFGPTTLSRFISTLDPMFKVKYASMPDYITSLKKLPQEPTVLVLPGS